MTDTYDPTDNCPGCGHPLNEDTHGEDGCIEGWEYSHDGYAIKDGCHCNLRLV